MRTLTSATLSFLFLVGCGSKAGQDSGTSGTTDPSGLAASLVDRDFLLDSADGFDPVAGTTVQIGFQAGSGAGLSFSMSAGCNQLSGDFELVDDTLIVSGWGMTEMGCEAELMSQDDWLVSFITSGPLLSLTGDELTLTGSSATLVFLDREVADPDRALTENTWTVDSFIEGKGVTNYSLDNDPTLSFSDDGFVGMSTGCNQASGSYTVDGDEITFAKMSMTGVVCKDKMAAAAESHLLAVIVDGTSTYGIDASRLTIERGTLGISATTD